MGSTYRRLSSRKTKINFGKIDQHVSITKRASAGMRRTQKLMSDRGGDGIYKNAVTKELVPVTCSRHESCEKVKCRLKFWIKSECPYYEERRNGE
jgi:hypothetical protein